MRTSGGRQGGRRDREEAVRVWRCLDKFPTNAHLSGVDGSSSSNIPIFGKQTGEDWRLKQTSDLIPSSIENQKFWF